MTSITPNGFISSSQDLTADTRAMHERTPAKASHPVPKDAEAERSPFAEHLDASLRPQARSQPTQQLPEKPRLPLQKRPDPVYAQSQAQASPPRASQVKDVARANTASAQRLDTNVPNLNSAMKAQTLQKRSEQLSADDKAEMTYQTNTNVTVKSKGKTSDRIGVPSDTAPSASEASIQAAPAEMEELDAMPSSGTPSQWMQQSPALALLAGHLEMLEPVQIPTVVAQSPLLQSILSAPSTDAFLQSTFPMQQNLQLLGLASADTPALANQSAPQTLSDALQTLGFDVSRLAQEGDLLRDNLGLEGLQSYIERAERLRAAMGLVSPGLNPMTNLQPGESPSPQPSLGSTQATAATRLQEPKAPSDPLQNRPELQEFAEPLLGPLAPTSAAGLPIVLSEAVSGPKAENPGKDFAAIVAKTDTALLMTGDSSQLAAPALPKAPLARQDPFQLVAQSWNAETLQTFRPEDSAAPVRPELQATQSLRTLDDLLSRQLIQTPEIPTRADSVQTGPQDAQAFDVNNALPLALADLNASNDNQSDDGSSRQQNQPFMNQDASSLLTSNQGPAAPLGANKPFTIHMNAPQAATPMLSPQHLQDVLDKSSMLIKEGGGSIRLDLGSKDMGPLDLALDIQGNSVSLRIVTHSDQAREALVQELPKLRESLHHQHLNLEKVEIGLSYSSAWSQSSGNNRQNREQVFEDRTEKSSLGPGGIRSTSRSYRQSFSSGPEARVPLHNGLIQVRV